ncbi:MAG: hypothetical protein GX800_07635, partial [Clostridiaceae bacterium]|nr:hypothetical protein [Clostridiaceae bacterium]
LLTTLLMCIPLINLVLLFVWAFGSNTEISKSNWAKAALIWMFIGIVLSVLLAGVIGGLLAALSGMLAN